MDVGLTGLSPSRSRHLRFPGARDVVGTDHAVIHSERMPDAVAELEKASAASRTPRCCRARWTGLGSDVPGRSLSHALGRTERTQRSGASR
jgi:hypothetical protein